MSWYRDEVGVSVGIEFLKVGERMTFKTRASEGGVRWKESRDMCHNVVICNKWQLAS